MKNNFFLVLIFFTTFISFSQGTKVFPPSPEASSLGKFVESPVSYFTGLPQIDIPIFSKTIDNVSLNVGISYHAQGIKVDEIASRVGIGWALNAGGLITRQIRGDADDSIKGYLNARNGQFLYPAIFNDPSFRASILTAFQNGDISIDLNPDVFMFNFMGKSGKFIIDCNTKKAVIQKFTDLVINPIFDTNGIIIGFESIDDLGTKYYFGQYNGITARDYETSQSFVYKQSNGQNAPSGSSNEINFNSWHLLKIVTPNQKTITFTYDLEQVGYYRKSCDEVISNSYVSAFSRVNASQYQIREITFDDGKVTFNKKSVGREDLSGSYVLDNVTISNNNSVTKVFNLKYNYTTSAVNSNGLSLLKGLEPQAAKRLFLNEVLEYSESRYKFEYNSNILPNRFSSSQDSWGFNNGKDNGQFLAFFNGGVPSNPNSREVDTNLSKSGLLQKIIYPTKGSTEYIYEPNIVKKPGFYDQIYTQNSNPVVDKYAGFFKRDSLWNGSSYKQSFKIGSTLITNSFVSDVSLSNSGNCGTNVYIPGCSYRFILRGNGNAYELFKNSHPIYNITPGDYELEVVPIDPNQEIPSDFTNTFNVLVSWKEMEDTQNSNNIYAGGSRLAQIVSRDSNNDIINQRSFSYNDSDGNTSGLLHALPAFYPIAIVYHDVIQFGDKFPVRPGGPLTSLQGNSIGYSNVTEYLGTPTNNIGKIEYQFTNVADSGTFFLYPFCPPTDNEWLRGIMLEKNYAKPINSGTSYKTIKKEQYFYKFANEAGLLNNTAPLDAQGFLMPDGSYPSFNARVKKVSDFAQWGRIDSEQLSTFYKYTYLFGAYDLDSVITTEYFDNATTYQTTASYKYNYEKHYQKSEESNTVYTSPSATDLVVKKYFYASELSGEPNATLLEANNIKALPLKTQTFKQGVKIAEEKTIFKDWGNGIVTPEIFQSGKENQPLENKLTYNKYDDKGNILQYTPESGMPVTIIWGYNKTQPIAKVENAAYSQVSSYVANLQSLSDTGTEANLLTALNALRTALPGTMMVTTYTYKPLVGVSTITDPKEDKTTFTYDPFGRLEFVKDKNGNILSENQYNYKP